MKKRKEYLAVLKLSHDYDDFEDDDVGEEGCYSADGVRWEMISWLEDLGFVIEHIDVVEDRGA